MKTQLWAVLLNFNLELHAKGRGNLPRAFFFTLLLANNTFLSAGQAYRRGGEDFPVERH